MGADPARLKEVDAGEPDWVRQAWRATLGEITLFLRTLFEVCAHPRRFASEWADGRRRALNPIAFALSALAITGPYKIVVERLLGYQSPSTPLWVEAARQLVPAVPTLMLALALHPLMRAGGSTRRPRSTLALTIYATFGPRALVGIVTLPFALRELSRAGQRDPAAMLATAGVALVFSAYLGGLQSALHRVRWPWVAVGLLLGWTLLILLGTWAAWLHFDTLRGLLS